MRLDVLRHRLSDRPRPVLDPLVAPHPIELRDDLVGDVETCSHGLVVDAADTRTSL
ncbi:hypothetical protein BN903_7 [Halorubrum sp. AJ67]|nr:hypothetical protein BN903_7 [Halorubrum sp. AJ67]